MARMKFDVSPGEALHGAAPEGVSFSNLTLEKVGALVAVTFDVTWDRSWRCAEGDEPYNWDAAWVFFKYSSSQTFRHARVDPSSASRSAALVVEPSPDGMGAFLYRGPRNVTTDGTPQRVVFRRVRLICDMGRFEGIQVWPFGLEMVYVPAGPFHLGDPAPGAADAPQNCFFDASRLGAEDASYLIDGPGPLAVGPPPAKGAPVPAEALLSYSNDDEPGGVGDWGGPVPAAFPNGYGAFYVMKRQVTQGEYADFVNTLHAYGDDPNAYPQVVRYPYAAEGTFRATFHISNDSDYARVATRPLRPCNHMSWADAIAYLAWAGLRPMTELEYEKACRGPLPAVAGEYAWGTTTLIPARVIIGSESHVELVTGNCNIGASTSPFRGGDGGLGPVRDDAFAALGRPSSHSLYGEISIFRADGTKAQPLTDRESTGRSYYGIPSLTGNLWELCVSIGNPVGRAFVGDHGQGVLTRFGEAPTVDQRGTLSWPGPASWGYAWRGDSWYTDPDRGPVAARPFGSGAPGFFLRSHDAGFRGARTAPPASAAPHQEAPAKR